MYERNPMDAMNAIGATGPGASLGQATRAPEIQLEISRLHSLSQDVLTEANELINRLSPVLSPSGPDELANKCSPPPVRTEMGAALHEIALLLIGITEQLRETRFRLEI